LAVPKSMARSLLKKSKKPIYMFDENRFQILF
jgi:hypothetical protein